MGHTHERIITRLQSNNVRERQDALSQMEEALADENITEKLNRAEDWIALFDGLSRFVSIETATCTKKGWDRVTAVSLKRLEKAGGVIRSGAEKYTEWFSYKVIKVLVKYLIEGMVDKRGDRLLPPLALNYIKTMVALFKYSPHLEHLGDDIWISLVSLAFAVILNESLLGGRGFDDDALDDTMDAINLDLNEIESDDGDDAMDIAPVGSKRPRASPPPKKHHRTVGRTLSPEQIEFMGLLTILLKSPYAPLLQDGIAQKILNRLHRFFELYPTWSIAHTNAIISVNIMLNEVELNMIKATSEFALRMWSPLLLYWTGKERRDKAIKEELVITMITFLHLVMAPKTAVDNLNEIRDHIDELYTCLEEDINNSTFEGLQLESLRLHLHIEDNERGVFYRRSFHSGSKFDRPQVLSWAILELYVDCAMALHELGERPSQDDVTTSSTSDSTQRKRRRRSRRSSPLHGIIDCVGKDDTPTKKRIDTLQLLLFIIDRHWPLFPKGIQQETIQRLSSILNHEDVLVQSWAYVCLAAAIAAHGTKSEVDVDWHSIWLQAVHRTNASGVGRGAAHAAHSILATQRLPLHVVLPDIETFASNLVVQGPAFPFDSTCDFLCDCLRIASQDMRLYRTYLPEKVIVWLCQNWNVIGFDLRSQLPNHTVADLLSLLEEICSLSKRNTIHIRRILPDSVITDFMVDRQRTRQHRDFLTHTCLKPFCLPDESRPSNDAGSDTLVNDTPLTKPTSRESRISDFFIRSLDRLLEEWPTVNGIPTDPTPEQLRRTIDMIVLVLYWEATLVLNATQSNRRVIRTACNIMTRITPCLSLPKWKPHELAMFLTGLDPLISTGDICRLDDPWDLLVGPGEASGVKRSILSRLSQRDSSSSMLQRELQVTVWKFADVQDAFKTVTEGLIHIVKTMGATGFSSEQCEEEDDGFGPIQVANATNATSRAQNRMKDVCIELCINFLAVAPMLQSGTLTPTRDRSLVELVTASDPAAFLVIAPHYLECVRRKQVFFSDKHSEEFANLLNQLVVKFYATSGNLASYLLAIQFVHSTSHLWMTGEDTYSKLNMAVRSVHGLIRKWISRGKMEASWKLRDRLICYLDHYLSIDPRETRWGLPSLKDADAGTPAEDNASPSHLLPEMADDSDVRVRFRAAVANARLLLTSDKAHSNLGQLYTRVFQSLTSFIDKQERMMTRFIHLANAMIISSEIRRGPYWHLLETYTADDDNIYTPALVAVLTAVATRLGLPNLRSLFEAYASQLVGTLIENGTDVFAFPMSLIGYEDRRDWGQSTFHLLAPTVLATTAFNNETVESAQQVFANHCLHARKSLSEGVAECFSAVASIIGLTAISQWTINEQILRGIDAELTRMAASIRDGENARARINGELDRAVFAALRTLSDTDYSPNGPIIEPLAALDPSGKSVEIFVRLNRYRKTEDFVMHDPNLPAFNAAVVLDTLRWLDGYVGGGVFKPAIAYHVVHRIAAEIEKSPLVNEQLRLLQALSIWISICHVSFRELTLLRILLRIAIPFLTQYDLAHSAQGLISWVLKCYCAGSHIREAMLPDLLGRIASICHDYTRSRSDPFAKSLGYELLDWIEEELFLMHGKLVDDVSEARPVPVLERTLPLWPRQPKGKLAELHVLATDSPSQILQSAYTSSAKFRLVRYLRNLSKDGGYAMDEFCRCDFWHLKSCIPPPDEIQDDDTAAFVDLLYESAGRICSPEAGFQLNTASHTDWLKRIFTLHEKSKVKVNPKEFTSQAITFALLGTLSTENPAQVHRSYCTLRMIFGNSFITMQNEKNSWLEAHGQEIAYLCQCPPRPVSPVARSLSELSTTEIPKAGNFSVWVKSFASLLTEILGAKTPFYAQITHFVQDDVDFAERTVPILVHQVLYLNGENARSILSDHFTCLLRGGQSDQCRVVVNTVLHLRNFRPDHPSPHDPLSYDKWLNIDYQLLSQGAMEAGAYTTALLFLELAREYQSSSDPMAVNEDILYSIYSHIEEPDGFYGIASKDVRRFLTRRFYHEGQWDMAFKFHNAEFAAGEPDQEEGICRSLHFNGYDKLAMAVLQSSRSDSNSLGGGRLGYELAWRTDMWDLPDPRDDSQPGVALYTTLRAIHRSREQYSIDDELKRTMHKQITQLSLTGDEDMRGIRSRLQTLVCLGEIRKWRQILQNDQASQTVNTELQSGFADISAEFDFPFLESIVATRMSLLRSTLRHEQIGQHFTVFGHQLKDVERRCLVTLSQAARQSDKGQIALNAITEAQRLDTAPVFDVSEEFANVLWLQKEHRAAVEYLQSLANSTKSSDLHDILRQSLILSRLGTWSAEASLQGPTDIREHYFEPAASRLVEYEFSTDAGSKLATVFHQYAMFAEERYHAILNSPELIRLRIYTQRREDRQAVIQRERKMRLLYDEDQKQLDFQMAARQTFLQQAIEMYSRCLQASDDFNDNAVVRLCSLWFANFSGDENIQCCFGGAIQNVSSWKFLMLSRQLCARLTDPVEKPQQYLRKLITRMCQEHPFHSVYQLWAMQDPETLPGSLRRASRGLQTRSPRAEAAHEILAWCQEYGQSAQRVRDMSHVCEAYLNWAKFPIKNTSKPKGFRMPREVALAKLRDVAVPVATSALAVDLSMRYENIVTIHRYSENVQIAGGLSQPKINECIGSDAQAYRQLFKGEGEDDLRQDAVVMQVFELVDLFLKRDRRTKARSLGIHCYKVIPLASQAGLIEFVKDTTALNPWLVSAHKRYRPQDTIDCRAIMGEWRDKSGPKISPQEMCKRFIEIKKQFRPVFRHFFTEKHKEPMAWFATRLKYTRSCATTSIAGHILGLGDRHLHNILIDNKTGELVHIDMGIAFDQGLLLRVPELVPFRLTEDVVDGFGMTGTEGVFRRCAEETLRVLRAQSGVIITILEVFRHDPLHSWTVDDAKVKKVQGMSEAVATTTTTLPPTAIVPGPVQIGIDSDQADEAADRALSSVRRKLDQSLSVEHTVSELITAATDPANLSRMFHGWSPFM